MDNVSSARTNSEGFGLKYIHIIALRIEENWSKDDRSKMDGRKERNKSTLQRSRVKWWRSRRTRDGRRWMREHREVCVLCMHVCTQGFSRRLWTCPEENIIHIWVLVALLLLTDTVSVLNGHAESQEHLLSVCVSVGGFSLFLSFFSFFLASTFKLRSSMWERLILAQGSQAVSNPSQGGGANLFLSSPLYPNPESRWIVCVWFHPSALLLFGLILHGWKHRWCLL